ncbi:aldehyde dehydrogenase family protein [Georgenia alba]|uniref:Aldehyde dehydrogenase family protein n=1 Tax=Georgenia alba TaxID=2233858 RepID=A0ABW2QE21_9MICO
MPEELPAATAVGAGAAVSGGEPLPVDDPATGEVVGWCVPSDGEAVDRAVRAAAEAFRGWADLPPGERESAMLAGAAAIEAEAEALASTLVAEVGKPLFEARGDVAGAVHLLRAFAALAEEAAATADLAGRPGAAAADEVLCRRVPLGPVAVITPWNTPVYLTMNCVGPALAAGCSVVVKPAEAAPLAVTAALRLLAGALPDGVLQVVQGTGSQAGTALTTHPAIRGVTFVGGVVAGRKVLAAAAETVKKVSLELGGNDPALVLQDADLGEDTLRELVAGCYAVSGQVCFNVKRIYVHRTRYEELVERFTAMVDQLVVGPGSVPGVHLGPLTTPAGHANAGRLLAAARQAGAHVHEGGRIAPEADLERGRYVRPCVVTGIARDHELVLAEQFAPIIPILPVEDDADAIAEANRTEYGLCSSVWSADPDHARAVALRLEAGTTFVGAHRVGASPPVVPFGGVKQSGLGRNHLMHAIAECTEEHAIVSYSRPSEQIRGIEPWRDLTSRTTAPEGART